MSNIFNESKWVKLPTNEAICDEITKALGGDFLAVVETEYLFKLFDAWRNATKQEESQKRSIFLVAFDRALDRAIKRKKIYPFSN